MMSDFTTIAEKEVYDVHLDDEGKEIPYCTDCGNDALEYIDQYANGEFWRCKECSKEFIW